MIKGYKIRLYPTKEQEELMWKHVYCCRFIWNYMLDLQETRYKNGEKHLSAFSMAKLLAPLKKEPEYEWLNEVSRASLSSVCRNLADAYDMFFKKKKGHPKFKSRKKSKDSFPVRYDRTYFANEKLVVIPKIGKVKYKTDFNLPIGRDKRIINPSIANIGGKWIFFIFLECENQALKLKDESMGIDLGIKELAVVAFGDEKLVFHNINKSKRVRKLEDDKNHLHKIISRKYEASKKRTGRFEKTNNIIKLENKLRKKYALLSNIRQNYIHQTTHTLVSMRPKSVVMENLDVSGMLKNKHLSKKILDQCFYEFVRQIKYKCEWSGIEFVQVDRFYPSSKKCSHCGAIKHDLRLSDRTYVCDKCGTVIDCDYNAAINLMKYIA